ncbi:hypothetical protein Plec18167_004671 [Paecilomyces lecythidis]|uniref:F-box domain-containing protein n=1 Tax=Paecilomyces lecythidis TaxID=3004212 RepID=A0ABR3XNX5_9EURO
MQLQQQCSPSSQLASLPNELLAEILFYLDTEPPSTFGQHDAPSLQLTESAAKPLKNLACTSSQFYYLTRPTLFAHLRFDIRDERDFLTFVQKSGLRRYVRSLVVTGKETVDGRRDTTWWQRVLRVINPQRITIVASPLYIGDLTLTKIVGTHSWAFEIPFQILQLEQDLPVRSHRASISSCPALLEEDKNESSPTNIMSARQWTNLTFNESSSLRAYNHYEYFLLRIPSVFDKWGTLVSDERVLADSLPDPLPSLTHLTSFHYTAVFPFYNHVKLVLDVLETMTELRTFRVQLAPGKSDSVIEDERRGSMDPRDPWMEITTGYSLIAHAVRDAGSRRNLVEFQACDYAVEQLQADLRAVVGTVLGGGGWVHDDCGVWRKN